MGIGPKIKEFRTKSGLTQKDLAEKLNVTYQAVSRWENDDVEPSFDSIKDMCEIFDCSTDDLFGIERKKSSSDSQEVKVIEKIVPVETKQVLTICEECNQPIYESADIHRITYNKRVRHGRHHTNETISKILCSQCHNKRIEEEKINEKNRRIAEKESLKKKRKSALLWPTFLTFPFLLTAFVYIFVGDFEVVFGSLLLSYPIFAFLGTLILNNTFVNEMWLTISSWGITKFPGIIFDFSADGIIFFIAMKVLFFAIGLLISAFAVVVATILAIISSLFAYPSALKKNYKAIQNLKGEF